MTVFKASKADVLNEALVASSIEAETVTVSGFTEFNGAVDFGDADAPSTGSPLTMHGSYINLSQYTTAQLPALTGMRQGSVVFDITTSKVTFYDGANWVAI